MSFLGGLWLVSLALSAAAVLIMIGLIAARGLGERKALRAAGDRRELLPLLLAGEQAEAEARDRSLARTQALMADLSVELIQLVRGDDKAAFVRNAARLGVADALHARLASGTARTRIAAAEALADFDDPETRARLAAALDDPNPDVRLTAALAMADMGEAPPVRDLIGRLRLGAGEDSLLMVALFTEIAAAGRADEVKALVGDHALPLSLRVAAIDALAETRDFALVPVIAALALAADSDAPEQPRLLDALGRLGHPAASEAIMRGLDSPAWPTRVAAARAAGRIGLRATAGRLAELLGDPEWWVRYRAGEALIRLGRPGLALLGETACLGHGRSKDAARRLLAEKGLGV